MTSIESNPRPNGLLRSATACALHLFCAAMLGACGGGSDDAANSSLSAPPDQGTIESTNRTLDLSLNHEGMFTMVDPATGDWVYSRYGRFDLDRQGQLVHSEGWKLAGRVANAIGAPVAALPPIAFTLPVRATSIVTIEANLDARSAAVSSVSDQRVTVPFEPNEPTSYNFGTSFVAYDSSSHEVAVALFFRKEAEDAWAVFAARNQVVLGDGKPVARLAFASNGGLLAVNAVWPLSIPAQTSVVDGTTEAIQDLTLDFSRMSQYGTFFGVTSVVQDGYPTGQLVQAVVSRTGEITADYDNGQVRPAGQIVLAKFSVSDRLGRIGINGWTCGQLCSGPIMDLPGKLFLGDVVSATLEIPK